MWILPKNYPLSSAFAADLVASREDLTLPGLNIEQSLMWRSSASPLQTWLRRWKTDSYLPHLYTRILKPSRRTCFEEKLASSLADIHANLSQQQESDSEQMTQDTCGRTSGDTSKQLDLLDAFLKTSRDTSRLDSPASSAIWKKIVTEQRGEYSVRVKSALLTRESEFTSWLSPTTIDISRTPSGMQKRVEYRASIGRKYVEGCLTEQVMNRQQNWATPRTTDAKGGARTLNEKGQRITLSDPTKTYGANLSDQVRLWPTVTTDSASSRTKKYAQGGTPLSMAVNTWLTPMVQDSKHSGTNPGPNGKRQLLVNQVNWPTPTVQDGNKATKKMRDNHQNNLTAVVFSQEAFPTPTTRDWKGGYNEASLTRSDGKSRRFDALPNAVIGGVGTDIVTGHLNPDWVEWLMGVPTGWTALGSWGTGSCQQQPPKRGEC